MCGLAGYNCKKELVTKFLPEGGEKEVLREAWLHNLHRGEDAAGYFGFRVEDDTLDVYKKPGNAIDVLQDNVDKDSFTVDPMYVFGAHTRAFTLGTPSDNDNNHPLSYGGVTVTHNGVISNHHQLRNKYLSKEELKTFPVVDSAVIPLVLSKEVDGPFDVEGLYKALKMFVGAFSIHAVWSQFPGVSVFARGTGRPFVFAELKNQMLAYASEDEGLWALITALGINPNVNFDWWELDTEHFLVVDAGQIVKWGSFRSAGSVDSRTKKTQRWLPRETGRKRTLVYQTDSDFDFANKAEATSILHSKKDADLIYTRRDGFVNVKDTYPVNSPTTIPGVCAEADEVYVLGEYLYAFYGDVEIVYNKSRGLQDVFNHKAFKNNQRFQSEEKKSIFKLNAPGASLSLADFLRLRTTTVKAPPTKPSEYAYVDKWKRELSAMKIQEAKKNAPKALPQTGFVALAGRASGVLPKTPMELGGITTDSEEDTDENQSVEIVQPTVELTWNNFWEKSVVHDSETMFFLEDKLCPTHKETFTKHFKVNECKVLLNAASYAMAACSSIELYQVADPSVRLTYAKSDNYCQDDGDRQCRWAPAEFAKVTNGFVSWLVRTSERCLTCDTWREVDPEPKWFDLLRIEDRLIIAEGEKRYANAD